MENIEKMINCGNPSFGGAMYGCPHCGNLKSVPFRYHSRFCPACGNKYSMERTTSMSFKLVNVQHRHCLIFEGGYSYDGVFVTFHYNRHEDEKYVEETLPAMDFIKRLIRHIPEKHFKMIRYGGIYARLPAGCFQFTRTPTTVFPIKKKRLQYLPKWYHIGITSVILYTIMWFKALYLKAFLKFEFKKRLFKIGVYRA